jgi:enamine deaminase RidA (YjgF/YER057c/UK114 family)
MRAIQHPDIPTPAGHYSPIVEHGGVLYVSGQLPAEEDGAFPEGIEAQTLSALGKVRSLVEAAGSRLENIIQVRIYVSDVELWGAVNETYAGFFGAHRPARIVVPTGPLHGGCLVEIEATAAAG